MKPFGLLGFLLKLVIKNDGILVFIQVPIISAVKLLVNKKSSCFPLNATCKHPQSSFKKNPHEVRPQHRNQAGARTAWRGSPQGELSSDVDLLLPIGLLSCCIAHPKFSLSW